MKFDKKIPIICRLSSIILVQSDKNPYFKHIMQGIILGGSIILISGIYIHYFYKRKKEFALLMVNGLGNAQVLKLTMIELTITLSKVALFSIVGYGIVYLIGTMQPIVFLKSMSFLEVIQIIGWLYISIFGCTFIVSSLYIKKFNPEAILRK